MEVCLSLCSSNEVVPGKLSDWFLLGKWGLEWKQGVGERIEREKRLCLWFYGLLLQLDFNFCSSEERQSECICVLWNLLKLFFLCFGYRETFFVTIRVCKSWIKSLFSLCKGRIECPQKLHSHTKKGNFFPFWQYLSCPATFLWQHTELSPFMCRNNVVLECCLYLTLWYFMNSYSCKLINPCSQRYCEYDKCKD